MEKRKESLSALKLCRFCLTQNESLGSLYDRHHTPKNSVDLPLKILSCVSIEVFPSDKMPSFICNHCRFFMDLFYKYKQICRQSDENILQYIQNGTPLESVPWPPSLIQAYQNSVKNEVVKTVVEGGATVQVSTQDVSDSDYEEEENVFNVTIADGFDEGSKAVSTCIKVVTSKDNQNSPKNFQRQDNKDSNIIEPKDKILKQNESGGLEDGCWPCNECERTYPLQQLLELHKKQKHRERTFPCDQCDAKFFTKYDLGTHQLRHSDEMPFQCVACDKKFKRLILLKRHEKIVHSDLPQQACAKCPATFLSVEELEAHQQKHTYEPRKRFGCACGKKYSDKAALERHKAFVRCRNPDFSCEYCPQQFTSLTKLARHVRSHAGERPYPCKHCDKSFMKSHHYTRHLRVKHRENIRSARGPFGQVEQYRCEQCEDTFSTQDELIYHSAIHATQNLTCPLCQEKFENVDDVTAHIKSHVNGVEFMCDFCELVFTTKEKLESHVLQAHEDEFDNEMGPDESSMEMDAEDDDDNSINVKDEGDHMVIEIKKADDYMLHNTREESEEKCEITNSEDSEPETTYTELSTVDTLAIIKKDLPTKATIESPQTNVTMATVTSVKPAADKNDQAARDTQTASILRKAEEVKRKSTQKGNEDIEKKEKTNIKSESNNSVGASNKSLQLLEKELQELKRTNNTRFELKAMEPMRNKRPQVHTSTPKTKAVEEKKAIITTKTPVIEKKVLERRVITKENKEPKEIKEIKVVNTNTKEEKEIKEKDVTITPKSVIKNGNADKGQTDEGIRRSTRPSKIKDYAKMIRDRSHPDEDDSDDADDEEYRADKPLEKPKGRKSAVKVQPKMIQTTLTATTQTKVAQTPEVAPTPPRKRGRPRKEPLKEVPSKIKKDAKETNEGNNQSSTTELDESNRTKELSTDEKTNVGNKNSNPMENSSEGTKTNTEQAQTAAGLLVAPSGQTLKKVPIKALPPGVKPLPLPVSARPMATGELCEMQIGKKMVKVQKIVMTKAEVEAMAKKGLVEMKDGTMVLKQGIKLPTADPVSMRSSLVSEGDAVKESPTKKDKAAPSRCELDDDT
ncbi:unnamed protein product [Parnassius mnemosyne]|uniref:Uncharacterized protein n=1 Tax=Parnassius mnemosyne TaxID=213953 RepID=A0AAV1M0K5_9NEOP